MTTTLAVVPHTPHTRYRICSQHLTVGAHVLELLVGEGWAVLRLGRTRWRVAREKRKNRHALLRALTAHVHATGRAAAFDA